MLENPSPEASLSQNPSLDRSVSVTLPLMRRWSLRNVKASSETDQRSIRAVPADMAVPENVCHPPERLSQHTSSLGFSGFHLMPSIVIGAETLLVDSGLPAISSNDSLWRIPTNRSISRSDGSSPCVRRSPRPRLRAAFGSTGIRRSYPLRGPKTPSAVTGGEAASSERLVAGAVAAR